MGNGVAICGDGTVVVAAAHGEDVTLNEGAVYVWVKEGTGWAGADETLKLTSSAAAQSDYLGVAVAISLDGSVIGAGAYGAVSEAGAVCIYDRPVGGRDTHGATEDSEVPVPSDLAAGDWFGASLGFSEDGNLLAVGANGDTVSDRDGQGSVFLYTRSGSAYGASPAKLCDTAAAWPATALARAPLSPGMGRFSRWARRATTRPS